jgi:hypothetical protein
MLVTINNRIATLENDTVKKSDIVDVVQSGNMNPLTSNAVATSNAMPVNSVTSGNMHSVTSNAVAEYANKVIKYKEVSISNIALNNQGFTDLASYVPSGMNNFMFALLYGWGSTSTNTPIAIETNGRWLWGEPSSSANNVKIRYYYTD